MAPQIIEDLTEMERTIASLKLRDLRSMGFEAKIAHKRRLDRLSQAYAEALRNTQSANLPAQEAPTDP